jgi:hypothetical protein
MEQIGQRIIVLSLPLKGLSTKAVHSELVTMLHENAVSHSSVTRFYSAGRSFWT